MLRPRSPSPALAAAYQTERPLGVPGRGRAGRLLGGAHVRTGRADVVERTCVEPKASLAGATGTHRAKKTVVVQDRCGLGPPSTIRTRRWSGWCRAWRRRGTGSQVDLEDQGRVAVRATAVDHGRREGRRTPPDLDGRPVDVLFGRSAESEKRGATTAGGGRSPGWPGDPGGRRRRKSRRKSLSSTYSEFTAARRCRWIRSPWWSGVGTGPIVGGPRVRCCSRCPACRR